MRLVCVVSFDLEGTLVDMTFGDMVWNVGLPRLYALKKGLDFDEARRIVLGEYARVGEDRVEWYDIHYWFRLFDLSGNPQRLMDAYRGYIRLFPDVVEALERLGRRYQLIIVTNSNRLFVDVLAQPVIRYFDHVFSTTSDFGLLKKNPDAYRRVCMALGIEPSEMVHVGDRVLDDFESPRSVGVNAYFLDRQDACTCVPVQYKVRSLHELVGLLT